MQTLWETLSDLTCDGAARNLKEYYELELFWKKSQIRGDGKLPLEEIKGEDGIVNKSSRELRIKFGNGHNRCKEKPGSFVIRQCSSKFNL